MTTFDDILITGVFDNILSYLAYWEVYYLTFSSQKMLEYTSKSIKTIHCKICELDDISVKIIDKKESFQTRKIMVKCFHTSYMYSSHKI
jgi:hypothetical protein